MIDLDLTVRKPGFTLRAAFCVPESGVTGIYGPSGCGKTTLLRAVAGLEKNGEGVLKLSAGNWQDSEVTLAPEDRRLGVVFQDAGLFSHLNVQENLHYARKRIRKTEQAPDLNYIIELLEIGSLLLRDTLHLSGGERQRVSIARALASSPAMLLMDEPLSAVDESARGKLITLLEKVIQSLDIPVLYVTHSSDEIARLADNLVLMSEGRVSSYGPLAEVLGEVNSPLNLVDELFSVLRCHIESQSTGLLQILRSEGGQIIQIPHSDEIGADQQSVRLKVRARDVSVCLNEPVGSSILNIIPSRILDMSQHQSDGSRILKLDIRGESIMAKVSEYSVQQLKLQPGDSVFAQIKSAALLS